MSDEEEEEARRRRTSLRKRESWPWPTDYQRHPTSRSNAPSFLSIYKQKINEPLLPFGTMPAVCQSTRLCVVCALCVVCVCVCVCGKKRRSIRQLNKSKVERVSGATLKRNVRDTDDANRGRRLKMLGWSLLC